MDGYELHHSSRRNKKGGGVALFDVDDLVECITVEIDMVRKRNVIVTCVYRMPGSKIEAFNKLKRTMSVE